MRAEQEKMKLIPHISFKEMFTNEALRSPLFIALMMMLAQQLSGINAVSSCLNYWVISWKFWLNKFNSWFCSCLIPFNISGHILLNWDFQRCGIIHSGCTVRNTWYGWHERSNDHHILDLNRKGWKKDIDAFRTWCDVDMHHMSTYMLISKGKKLWLAVRDKNSDIINILFPRDTILMK